MFDVKSFPTVSRSTLKKHSTSSVVLERGCSAGSPCSRRNSLRLTLVSISAARAISVSLVNPRTLLSGLTKQNKKVITTSYYSITMRGHPMKASLPINFQQAIISISI